MVRLYIDTDKYESSEAPLIIEAFHNALKDLVRQKLDEHNCTWTQFVFARSDSLITSADVAALERRIRETGYRYTGSAMISVLERPDAYKPMPGMEAIATQFCFDHPQAIVTPADETGRQRCGQGDNVVAFATNVVGIARYYRSVQDVMKSLMDGVPADTIAIIDDSGGTLTAPIIENFKGVLCAGGTVRSHLGILTREYGIPCLMNAQISGIFDGNQVELEVSAPAKTTEAYQQGRDMSVRVWKRAGGADGKVSDVGAPTVTT